jgi:hypothetical protein
LTLAATLAVVGLVASTTTAAEAISLAGAWRFRIDEQHAGTAEKWFAGDLAGQQGIKLPGTMDDARLGPKNTKPAALDGPYRLYDYAGPAWYQREVEIPAAWQAKRVTLLLERCRWVTSVWLDDRFSGTQESLIAPHRHDFGTGVTPGKHRLTILVDNTVKIDLGRFVSALFGGTWGNMNGIVGRIELAATPPTWIDDVQVYPDVDRMRARVVVTIGNATGRAGQGALGVGARSVDAAWGEHGGQAEVEVDMRGAKLWDEFAPNLSQLAVKLGDDSRVVRFGMRKFAARGTQFTLNGRPLYLRGTLECSVFPLTGYPPTEAASWRRIYGIMKSYGLNHIRFHSWCPPEAAFAAADEEGIMIQAEGPMANVSAGSDPARDAFIEAEFRRIVDTYGNHPSFCTMTLGNEYGGKDALLTGWLEMLIQRDPRHLYSSASAAQKTANRQWTEDARGRGIQGPGTQRDLGDVVHGDPRPTIGHEIGQWTYFPDFNEMKKYTGVMAIRNFQIVRDDLAKKHLLDLAPRYVQSCGRFATLLYKEEIEVLLRTPGYAGFSLLDLHDYPTQGTALVGPLDPFWDSKGFVTPQQHRRYCGPTVPLLRMKKRAFTAGEPFEATADAAHYGPQDLAVVQPQWSIRDPQGREIAAGSLATLRVPTGRLTPLGTLRASLAKAPAPCKLTVILSLQDTPYANDWEIWVYPDRPAAAAPAGVTVCREWDDAHRALAEGQTVAFFPRKFKFAQALPGRFLPVFWSPVWFPTQKPNTMGILCDPQHPALAQFPTESHSNWQWWDVLENSCSMVLDETPADYRPIVQVMDNFARNHKLGNLFEARVGKGRLLACTINLVDDLERRPAARQLLSSLTAYLASDKFRPSHELTLAALDKLFAPPVFTSTLARLGAKVLRVDSEDRAHGHLASMAIDGDPETFWHTRWKPDDPLPHEIVIDIGREVLLKGVTYLPRQDMANGRIAAAEIYCSNDPAHWGSIVARAKWRNSGEVQSLKFARSIQARYLKLVATREQRGQPFASIAELDILTEPDVSR